MDWFRHYDNASFDPKFRTVARIAGTTIERVVFVFWAMCEHVSASDSGGKIDRFDADATADHLGCNVTDVTCIVSAFRGRVHDGKTLTAWTRRQYKSDSSAERVRRWRDKKKAGCNVTETLHVTTCNGPEQSRTEQKDISDATHPHPASAGRKRKVYPWQFEQFWKTYPTRGTDTKASAEKAWAKAAGTVVGGWETLQAGAGRYAEYAAATGCETMLVQTWINREGWTASYAKPIGANGHGRQPAQRGVVEALRRLRESDRRREEGAADLADDGAHPRD